MTTHRKTNILEILLFTLLLQSSSDGERSPSCEERIVLHANGIPFLTESVGRVNAYERAVSSMSIRAKIFNMYLKASGMKKTAMSRYQSPQRSESAMVVPAKLFAGWKRTVEVMNGRRITTLEPTGDTSGLKHLVFFHGGAYASEITKFHWRFLDSIAKQFDCVISVLEYPLSPEYTIMEALDFSLKAYASLAQKSQRDMILVGDSAGGGLALALSQSLVKASNVRQPKKITLLSPWLDASFQSMPSLELQASDLMLSVEALKDVATRYAGELEVKNPLISPLFGDFSGLGEIGVWYGGSEIFSPDIEKFRSLLDRAKVRSTFSLTPHMQHDFVLFPIPEAKVAIKGIVDFLRK